LAPFEDGGQAVFIVLLRESPKDDTGTQDVLSPVSQDVTGPTAWREERNNESLTPLAD